MQMPVIWVDVETSGLDSEKHGALSLAAVRGWTDDVFRAEIQLPAELQFSPQVTQFNGYTEEIARSNEMRLTEEQAIRDFMIWLGDDRPLRGCVIGGANPRFDIGFINGALSRAGVNKNEWFKLVHVIDIQQVALFMHDCGLVDIPPPNDLARIPAVNLDSLAAFLNVPERQGRTHDALEDVFVTRGVYWALQDIVMRGR